jgi:predicted metal-dependent phosphoesterase TrpH
VGKQADTSIRWRKAELHTHCNLDPADFRACRFSAEELIATAAALGYEVLAITCHNLDVWTPELSRFAAEQGITLIPGMEVARRRGPHILVYNFGAGAEHLDTPEKIQALSRSDTLVIAPHPYFPGSRCLGDRLVRNIRLFDAIEISGFYGRRLDFNRRAVRTAAAFNKPLVGNADVHHLWQLGRTFTWIHSAPGIRPVIEAIRLGKVRVESAPLSYLEIAGWWVSTIYKALSYRGRASGGGVRRLFPASE